MRNRSFGARRSFGSEWQREHPSCWSLTIQTRPSAWAISAIEWLQDIWKCHESNSANAAGHLDRRLLDYPRCGAFNLAQASAASANRYRRGENGRATRCNRLCAAFHLFPEQPSSHPAPCCRHDARRAREVAARPERRFRGHTNLVIGFVCVGFATFVTAILALTTAIRPQPWFDPHYAIPLAGIILGNVLNSASLALDSFLGSVRRERQAIESRLSLGDSYREAIAPLVREAIRRGLLPIINQMSAAGIVTLPGIMTGQILAGLDPLEAVKYQILLMFLLSGGSGLSALAASYLAAWRLTDDRQRLRLDRLQ